MNHAEVRGKFSSEGTKLDRVYAAHEEDEGAIGIVAEAGHRFILIVLDRRTALKLSADLKDMVEHPGDYPGR